MYRDPHDGSYGLDLRDPALVERDRGQAVERARRISPMPVASCVRMVSQPAGGLPPCSNASVWMTGRDCMRLPVRRFLRTSLACSWIT